MRKLLKAFAGHGPFALGVVLFSLLLNGLFTVLDPLINKALIDLGLVERHVRLFAMLAAAVVLAGVVFRLGMWADALLVRRLQNAVTRGLAMRMLRAYFDAACPEATGAPPAYYLARIYDEPAQVAAGVVAVGIGLCVYAASLAGALAVSVYLAWKLTAVLLIAVPALFWLARRSQPRISQAAARENEEEARARGTVGQVVAAFKTVKMFGLEASVLARVAGQLDRRLALAYDTVRASSAYETASGILLSFAEALVLIGAAYEVVNGRLSIGGFFGYMSAFWKIINAGTNLVAQYSALAKVGAQVDRLLEFEGLALDSTTEAVCASDRVELAGVAVRFDSKTALDNLDLAIAPGERLLVLGPNGSGKSTLANLLAGFVRPSAGALRRPARARVAALLTPFHFVPGTLRDNVDYGRLDEPKRLLFARLVESFGLAARCDVEVASAFSEGEKKKAQILMTLLKDADLCLFDEPFAHLDVASKRQAMDLILESAAGKTLIVIMHGDDEFHRHFDRVIRLENGLEVAGSLIESAAT